MWILVTGDKIFVDNSSIVGSIGVISSTLDVTKLAQRFKINY